MLKRNKIGILYICTGQYTIFWQDFYLSAEEYFLTSCEIHYFVFTDSREIYDSELNNRIHIIEHQHLGWPDATLMRFHTFLGARQQLEKMDYLFFCNANLEIKKSISEEILPSNIEGLVVTKHPGFYNKKNTKFTYERNPKSKAYIAKGQGLYYVQGAFNGGRTESFLTMCTLLSNNIDKDKEKGITAIRHDESHLNRYILDHPYKLLEPSYLYPEDSKIPFDCIILIRNKEKYIPIKKIKKHDLRHFLNKAILYVKDLLCI